MKKSGKHVSPKHLSDVFSRICKKYSGAISNRAVSIFTPFSKKIPLNQLKLTRQAMEFIRRYEPNVKQEGLFSHQYKLLNAYTKGAKHFILTSATGSGKSLCFWTWIVDKLSKISGSTALVCLPTQALMWSQANRLMRLSDKDNLKFYDKKHENAYSGTLSLGNQKIGWTIWKGSTNDVNMMKHEKTEEFSTARIRLATLDKAHCSLIKHHVNFTKNLECVVLDEAHQYDGVFGANVMYFLKRLYVAKESAGTKLPDMFLVSATLSDAQSFAAKILSLKENDLYHVADVFDTTVRKVSINKAMSLLKKPLAGGLSRVVLFVDSMSESCDLRKLLDDDSTIGDCVNILYFSESKFQSRLLKRELDSRKSKFRKVIIYDADLPATERRSIENKFNSGNMKGVSLIATNALELGIDIDNLDLCIIDAIPDKLIDLIQRIGRVGRRQDSPGLIMLNLSAKPIDRWISQNLDSAFKFDASRSMPIPTDIEMRNLKSIAAIQEEMWKHGYRYLQSQYTDSWKKYMDAVERHFGKRVKKSEAIQRLNDRYGSLIDTSDKHWLHNGFRATASQGKISVRMEKSPDVIIALIEDVNIFRDAHPEAVYLDAHGHRWRVKSYGGEWKQAEWSHHKSDVALTKYLKSIDKVYVDREKDYITTRGEWEESFEFDKNLSNALSDIDLPEHGDLKYGIWEYKRKFTGYKERNLSTHKSKHVSLAQVSRRFKDAIEMGKEFPFLFPLSYRTYGWKWNIKSAFKEIYASDIKGIENTINQILELFLAAIVQVNPANFKVSLSLSNGSLQVLDSSPGGNGVSEALLRDGRIASSFSRCLESLNLRGYKKQKQLNSYLIQLCGEEMKHDPEEVINIIRKLQSYWVG